MRTAIITGAAKRVGRAITERLLAEGWRVIAHCREATDDVPEGAVQAVADLSEPDCAARIMAAAGEGPHHLLVNCAAAFARDDLAAPDAALFDEMMAVNMRAPMLLSAAFADKAAPGALIVHILDAKLAAPNPDYLSYTLSKYALAGHVEIAARGLGGRGIRVNGIAPALMLPSGDQDEAAFKAVHALNPLGHGVAVSELVEAILALVGQPSVTGQILTLDAGQRFMALPRDVAFLDDADEEDEA